MAAPIATPAPTTAASEASSSLFSTSSLTLMEDVQDTGSELQRIHTPPPTDQPDPDTLTKGKKQMSKAETWTPTQEEIYGYLTVHQICQKCSKTGHINMPDRCKKEGKAIPLIQFPTHPLFASHMEWWIKEQRLAKQPNRYRKCIVCHEVRHLFQDCPHIQKK